jgi:CheY-like chemotaxis protein/HPt (histidine-containing phosphotransfer) domain-containing protein
LHIRFSVLDNGVGIPEDKLDRVFESFTQADASTSKTYGGTGLGLAISRRLAELMGGRIWVESIPGVGSTFSFTVKLVEREQDQQARVRILSFSGLTAMVVDDNQTNRVYLSTLLTGLGFSVSEADCADSALASLCSARDENRLPAILLVDLCMPGGDGWSLMESLRAERGFDAVHRILMPSAGMRGDAERCRELCVDGYLVKPVISEEFHELLHRVLELRKGDHRERWPVTRHQIREEQVSLNLLVVDDVEVNRMVAQAILERMGHDITCVGSGREALEKLATGTFDAIFMDVQMPEMDGLQTTAAIRDREMSTGGRRIPIIAMTAYAMTGDRERFLGAGMDGYISKPVKPDKIRETLEQFFAVPLKSEVPPIQCDTGSAAARIEEGDERVPVNNVPDTLVFDHAGLVDRLGGEELVEIFLGKFRTAMFDFMEKLRTEMASGNTDKLKTLAHAIKGLAANIGAEQIRYVAVDMELAAKAGDLVRLYEMMGSMSEAFDIFIRETAPDVLAKR